MNAKQVLAAVAISFIGSAAMAVEATQFEPAPSTLTRAEVKAELAHAQAEGLIARGEASQFVDLPAKNAVARAEVRAEARAFARSHPFNPLYVGS